MSLMFLVGESNLIFLSIAIINFISIKRNQLINKLNSIFIYFKFNQETIRKSKQKRQNNICLLVHIPDNKDYLIKNH